MNALLRLFEENEDGMCNALAKDLHKSRQESIINEVEYLRNDVRGLIMNLRTYAATEYVSVRETRKTDASPIFSNKITQKNRIK